MVRIVPLRLVPYWMLLYGNIALYRYTVRTIAIQYIPVHRTFARRMSSRVAVHLMWFMMPCVCAKSAARLPAAGLPRCLLARLLRCDRALPKASPLGSHILTLPLRGNLPPDALPNIQTKPKSLVSHPADHPPSPSSPRPPAALTCLHLSPHLRDASPHGACALAEVR